MQPRIVKTFNIALFLLAYTWSVAAATELEKLSNEQIRALPTRHDLLIINFWATWCEPCVEEIPVFSKLQKHRKALTVIGISMDELNQEQKVRAFIEKHSMRYRVALWTGDDFESMVNSLDPKWDGPIPATFIFEKGKLTYSKIGLITEAELLKHLPG